jgi:signal transduction histidine kinase
MQSQDIPNSLQNILISSRNKLQVIFDSLPDPIFSVTPEMKLESLNMAAADLVGKHPRRLVNKDVKEFLDITGISPKTGQEIISLLHELRSRKCRLQRLIQDDTSQDPTYHQVTALPFFDDSLELALLILHVRDVTETKRLEMQLDRYSEHLEELVSERTRALAEEKELLRKANKKLQRLEELRQDLINMMVHDMKSPLAELMGNLDLLTYGDLDQMQREVLDMAAIGGRDLLRMIMNLLDISRLEGGRLELVYRPLDFSQLARQVVARFNTLIQLKGLKVTINADDAGEFEVDADIMERVLQNLLTNALHHTSAPGEIRFDAHQEGDDLVFSIADTGSGIPESYLGVIFDKFRQADNGRGPRSSTGLGLNFCKLAVEQHGGEIRVESRLGKGTTFFVRIPGKSHKTN